MERDGETGEMFEDFDGKPEIELLVFYGERRDGEVDYRHFGSLYLEDQEWEAMKGMQQMFDWRILECWREKETGRWRPKIEKDGTPRFRDDKDHANHHSVVEKVLKSIEDAVSEEDLIAAAGRIREAWKERERAAREKAKMMQAQQQQQGQGQGQGQQRLAAPSQQQQQQQVRKVSHEDDGPGYVD